MSVLVNIIRVHDHIVYNLAVVLIQSAVLASGYYCFGEQTQTNAALFSGTKLSWSLGPLVQVFSMEYASSLSDYVNLIRKA